MTDQIDKYELQRFLDGKLPADERELFLELADEQPQHWRTIALAFVEEQVLRQELSDLASGRDHSVSSDIRDEAAPAKQSSNWSSLLVQAAIALLLIGAGTLIGRYSTPSTTDPDSYIMVVAPEQTDSPPIPAQDNRGIALQTAMGLIPSPLFDQESRRVIHDHGYTVMEEPVLYMIQNQAGEQYVIPHRKVSLVAHNE